MTSRSCSCVMGAPVPRFRCACADRRGFRISLQPLVSARSSSGDTSSRFRDDPGTVPPSHRYPPKPRPGDRVAILSPSRGLPGILPLPYELGLRRLREDFGLDPVEYPTTKVLDADPRDRARDVN